MPWGDSHCIAFTEQAEARSYADHPSEKPAAASYSERSECGTQLSIFRLLTADRSLRRAILDLLAGCDPGDVQ
jgi:hypothetical protein